jgi:hypothetical protein
MQKAPFQGFFVAVMHFAVRRFTLETLADSDASVKPLNETRIAGTQSANAVPLIRCSSTTFRRKPKKPQGNFPLSSSCNPASSSTGTPSSRALVSLEPASSPATT